MGIWGVYTPGVTEHIGVYMYGVYKHEGCPDPTMLPLRSRKKPYLELIPTPKGQENILEKLRLHWNEPTLDIPIGGSGQGIKTKWQIHAMCENMFSHLSTDKEGKKTLKYGLNAFL